MKVTADEVEIAIKASKQTRLPIRECSICGYVCSYIFDNSDVFYDSGCNCTYGRGISNPQRQSFQDIANLVNIQSIEANAERLWKAINGEGKWLTK